jgi:hypothetical protein
MLPGMNGPENIDLNCDLIDLNIPMFPPKSYVIDKN